MRQLLGKLRAYFREPFPVPYLFFGMYTRPIWERKPSFLLWEYSLQALAFAAGGATVLKLVYEPDLEKFQRTIGAKKSEER